MDIYGSGGGSRDEWFIDDNNYHHRHLPLPNNSDHHYHDNFFSHFPSLHSDEAAELEWVSQFVDDTTSFIPDDIIIIPDSKSKSKKKEMTKESSHAASTSKRSKGGASAGMGVRRCSHCASEKTPQWRSGPLGPKTLCNACGVRFKSGRLVPEYRPAASPTFVLTQHSNSHRKVMELRRQKHLAAPPTINTL